MTVVGGVLLVTGILPPAAMTQDSGDLPPGKFDIQRVKLYRYR
jgi:hypothetical protein